MKNDPAVSSALFSRVKAPADDDFTPVHRDLGKPPPAEGIRKIA
jgi:hypothetical protein